MPSGRKIFSGIVFFTCLLCAAQQNPDAQETVSPEIRGTVFEFGISGGIDGVEVTLERLGDEAPRVYSPVPKGDVLSTTTTDASGAFIFAVARLGYYRIQVRKDGYGAPGPLVQRLSTSANVLLDSAYPRREVRFSLARPGEISGRVVDQDTKEPVASLPVDLVQYAYSRGRLMPFPGGSTTTDAQGRFVARGLAPMEYVATLGARMRPAVELNARPELQGEDLVRTEFSKDDLKQMDRDYEQTYWPGGSDLSAAFPVLVVSGGSVDLGELAVRKVPKYRVRVSFLAATCAEGDVARIDVRAVPDSWRRLGTTVGSVPCGKEFLMRGFSPGSYRLEVVVGGRGAGGTLKGWIPFEVVDRNIEISVPVASGVDVDGKVVVAEGASKPDLKKIQLLLRPIGWAIQGDGRNPIDAGGSFQIRNTVIRDHQLMIAGIEEPHYVKEIRYNGHRVSDNVVPMNAAALAHSLEIVVDDKPGAIMGSVTDRGKPVSQPHIVLARWPPNALDLFYSVVTVPGDEGGKFSFTGLAPGDYRLLAVSSDTKGKLDRPGVLERLLAGAEKLSLSERAIKNLALTLSEP